MVQDLITGDGSKKEVAELEKTVQKRDRYITSQDSLLAVKERTIESFKSTEKDNANIESINQRTIQILSDSNKKYKRQRNVIGIIAGACLLGLIIK